MKSIRIGLYGAPLAGFPSGIGRYVREICSRLDSLLPEAQFYVYAPSRLMEEFPSKRWHSRTNGHISKWLGGYAWLKFGSSRLIEADGLNAFWATRTLLPPLPPRTGSVSTVYDLNHLIVPSTMSLANRCAHGLWFQSDVVRSDVVVSISAGTSDRLERLVGCASDRIAIPGTDQRYRPPSNAQLATTLHAYGLDGPYLLSVGTLEPRKNLSLLIEAFHSLRATGHLPGYTLVLVGASGWKQKRFFGKGDSEPADVRFLGYVPEDDLPALYAGAELVAMPSLYEGYGIPVAEARSCGARVVATDIPELRQAGGPNCRYVEPTLEGLVAGILAGLADIRMPAEQAATWDAAASVMADALRDASAIGELRNRPTR